MRNKIALLLVMAGVGWGATTLPFYFGHAPVADRYGVIAPWYPGQNGQSDYRVRLAAETLKRYPWSRAKGVPPAPEYVYNGTWKIDFEGRISAPPINDWTNGDLGQRSAYVLTALVDYYRYSGDPGVFAPIRAIGDYLVDDCQADERAGWPGMLISVPTMGKPYGRCVLGPSEELKTGQSKIQLDIVAEVGLALVRAYELTGERRWYEAAKHWADLLAERRNRERGAAPWGRYANKASRGMNDVQTGSVVYLLAFFDELIRTGYKGTNGALVEARDAGRAWLHDVLLPAWYVDDTWGRNYWDWDDPVQAETTTDFAVHYLLDHKDVFENWRNDARNILAVYLNHTAVSPRSGGDVFHGAWALPESSSCCERSIWYPTLELASVFARYGVEAGSEWAREIARRSQILATYDPLPDGQSMDLIDGGANVNLRWFKIAHPMALKHVLVTMGWLPEMLGAARENHLMRASSVVRNVIYAKGRVGYSTFPVEGSVVEVLRLSFVPERVTAGGQTLPARRDLGPNSYTVERLKCGDAIVSIRHDGAAAEVEVTGADPQTVVAGKALKAGEALEVSFTGNQVRVIAPANRRGGYADVYVDDFKQLTPIDFYSPVEREHQVLFNRSGLAKGDHKLRVVARGASNPVASGSEARIESIQYSNAAAELEFGEGGGPGGAQRMIFGYTGRADLLDSLGNAWHPGMEVVARTGNATDAVARTWWTLRQAVHVGGTADAELYRYGIHWSELGINVTVAPGVYHARLKFAENEFDSAGERGIDILINGRKVVEGFDVLATAGGPSKAVDLVFDGIAPKNGVIEVKLRGRAIGGVVRDAMIQALEVGPGAGGAGAMAKTIAVR